MIIIIKLSDISIAGHTGVMVDKIKFYNLNEHHHIPGIFFLF